MLVYKVQHNVPDGGFWVGGLPTNNMMSYFRREIQERNLEPNQLNFFLLSRISRRKGKGKIWNSAVSVRAALKQLPKEILDILLVKEYELMPARTMSAHELAN
jgi:hypothetical protein